MPVPGGPLRLLNIEIYGGCDSQCVFCPQAVANGRREHNFLKKLPFSLFQKIVREAYTQRDQTCRFSVSLHGSGEPTLHPHLPEMISFVKRLGDVYVSFFTNGKNLGEKLARVIISAGIDEVTVSIVAPNREQYQILSGSDSFERVLGNITTFQRLAQEMGSGAKINTRHLIADLSKKDEEVRACVDGVIDRLGVEAEIWMPHSWAGLLLGRSREELALSRGITRRSCGRPHAGTLEVRAGGLNGHHGAVAPCPLLLGQDSSGVLGYLDVQSIDEVVAGEPFEQLRRAHEEGRFGDVPYCANCDYLYPDLREVLVWTNKPGRTVGGSQTAPVDYHHISTA